MLDHCDIKTKLKNILKDRDLQNEKKNNKPKTKKSTSRSTTVNEKPKRQDKSKDKSKDKIKNKNKKTDKSTMDSEDNTTRRWNDFKDRDLKQGQFSEEESQIVIKALCEYAYENNLQESDLIDLVTEKQTKERSVWPKISECLPDRSVQSIHNFCHRVLNPYNYKGAWTAAEEKKLIE
jgi:hypothetical protein